MQGLMGLRVADIHSAFVVLNHTKISIAIVFKIPAGLEFLEANVQQLKTARAIR